METIVIQTDNKEQSRALKAFLKAMKMKFKTSEVSPETQRIGNGIIEGYKEVMDIEAGKIKPKSYGSFKEIFDDL